MNRNQLQWFCNACDTQSFAKAAKSSFVSRQAFGKAIKNLETELECTLFQRTEQGVKPTEAALRIYPIAQRCVDDLRSMKRICDEYAPSPQRPVHIAIADGVIEALGDLFFDELELANPACEITIEKHYYTHCLDYLKDGSADFAIVPGPITDKSLEHFPIVRENLYAAASPSLINFPVENATVDDLGALPFFSLGTGEQAMLGVDGFYRKRGIELEKVDRYTEYRIVLCKAHAGKATALVPESMLSLLQQDMLVFPLPPEEVSFTLNWCWTRRALTSAEAGIVDFVRDRAAELLGNRTSVNV